MRPAPEGFEAVDASGRSLWVREGAARRVAVATDGSWIAGSEKMTAAFLAPADGSARFAFDAGFDPTVLLSLSGALVSGAESVVQLWEPSSGARRERAEVGARVGCACADGARALLGCGDGTVRVWTPGASVARLGTLQHPQSVSGIARSAEHVITASLARSLRVSRRDDGGRVAVVDDLRAMPWCLAGAPDGSRIAVGVGHAIEIRDVPTLRLIATYATHRAVVSTLAWTEHGLWSGAEDGVAVRHAPDDGKPELVLAGRGRVQSIAASAAITCVARAIERR